MLRLSASWLPRGLREALACLNSSPCVGSGLKLDPTWVKEHLLEKTSHQKDSYAVTTCVAGLATASSSRCLTRVNWVQPLATSLTQPLNSASMNMAIGFFFRGILPCEWQSSNRLVTTVQQKADLFGLWWLWCRFSPSEQRKEKKLKFRGAAGTASGQHLNSRTQHDESTTQGLMQGIIFPYFPRRDYEPSWESLLLYWIFFEFSPLSSVISLQGWLSRIWLWCWGANMPVLLACGLGDVQQTLNGQNPSEIGGSSADFCDQISHFRARWLESSLAELRQAEST